MSATLIGDKILMARLAAMPANAQRKIVLPGLRAGGQVLARAIRGAVPIYSGNLRKSIGSTVKAKRGAALGGYAKAGARRGYVVSRGIEKPSHAAAGMYGSVQNYGRKDGAASPNKGWMTNAANSSSSAAMQALIAKIRTGFAGNMRSW